MKKIAFLFLVALFFLHGVPVHAEGGEGVSATEPILVATVNIYNVTHAQNDHEFTIGFDISNRIGVQPGIRYGVVLAEETPQGLIPVHTHTYDEILTLAEGSSEKKTVTYKVPEGIEGGYTLLLVSKNEQGLEFGVVPVGQVTLVRKTPGVIIDVASCHFSVRGDTKEYSLAEGIDIAPNEEIQSRCIIENTSDTDQTVSPSFTTTARSEFGPVAATQGGDMEAITLRPHEKREVKTTLPRAVVPQAYNVTLSYDRNGNSVTYHYVLRGGSATVQNVTFDKPAYAMGDTAKLLVLWSPRADNFTGSRLGSPTTLTNPVMAVTLTDQAGNVCAETIKDDMEGNGERPITTVEIQLVRACVDPIAAITISDSEHGMLSTTEFSVIHSEDAKYASRPVEMVVDRGGFTPGLLFLISMLGLVLGLGILVYRKMTQSKYGPLTTPTAMFALFVFGNLFLGVQSAHADTFVLAVTNGAFTENHTVSVNLDKASYMPGETIQVSGSKQLTTCGNGSAVTLVRLYYKIDAGSEQSLHTFFINQAGLRLFSKDATAPVDPGEHTIQFYGDGNSTGVTIPFTVQDYASCSATVINGCTLGATSHGVAAGFCTVGTVDCGTGEALATGVCEWTGSCNYTCENGTWNEVTATNTCALGPIIPSPMPDLVSHNLYVAEAVATPEDPPLSEYAFVDVPLRYVYDATKQVLAFIREVVVRSVHAEVPSLIPPSYQTQGALLYLYSTFQNEGDASTGAGYTNEFYYQWDATDGPWTLTSAPRDTVGTIDRIRLFAGRRALDQTTFKIPTRIGNADLYVRHCLDVNNEIVESDDTEDSNCVTSAAIPVTGALACSDLIPASNLLSIDPPAAGASVVSPCVNYAGSNLTAGIVAPTYAVAGRTTTLRAIALNDGQSAIGASFNVLFQKVEEATAVADDPAFATKRLLPEGLPIYVTNIGTASVGTLGELDGEVASLDYVFPAEDAGTNQLVRMCVDMDGTGSSAVTESEEADNCGEWTIVQVEPGCIEEVKTWTVGANSCSATSSAALTGDLVPVSDSDGPTTGDAVFSCNVSGTWEADPESGATCTVSSVGLAPVVSAGDDQDITLPTADSAPVNYSASRGEFDVAGVLSPLWEVVSNPVGASPVIATPTSLDTTFQSLSIPGTYVFRLTVTSSETSESSSDTMQVVVHEEPAPSGWIAADPSRVSSGATSMISWGSNSVTDCSVSSTENADTWSGLSNGGVATSPLVANTSYVLTCDGVPRSGVTVEVNPDVTLTSSSIVVDGGNEVTITWDTRGNDESTCTLSGGGLSSALFNGTGVGTYTTEITGKTRFTLTCGAQTAVTEVEVTPSSWNS